MTNSARLQDMAGLVEGGKDKGTEMVKALGAEAKDALAGLQKMWLDVATNTMEKVNTIEASLPKGLEAMDPEKENAHIGAFMPVEEIVAPFMNHLKELQSKFPELNPWTNKVRSLSTSCRRIRLRKCTDQTYPPS